MDTITSSSSTSSLSTSDKILKSSSSISGEVYSGNSGLVHNWTNYQPMCFTRSDFTRNSFDIAEFVSDCCQRVSVESLRDELARFQNALQAELVELINKDYNEFVSLSASLTGVDKLLRSISDPLVRAQQELQGLEHYLADRKERFESILADRRALQMTRIELEGYLAMDFLVAQLEPVVGSLGSEQHEKGDFVFDFQMMRAVMMISKLESLTASLPSTEYVNAMAPVVARLTEAVLKAMRERLCACFLAERGQSSHQSELVQLIRMFELLKRAGDVEKAFLDIVARPALVSIMSVARLENGRLGGTEGLEGILSDVSLWLNEKMPYYQEAAELADSRADFVVHGFWAAVEGVFESSMRAIFSPGVADTFRRNYQLCASFLDNLETFLAHHGGSVQRLRSAESYARFMRKWSFPLYAQARLRDVVATCEVAASASPAVVPAAGASPVEGFVCPCIRTLYHSLTTVWRTEIYMQPVFASLLRFSLQCLARARLWIAEGLSFAGKPATQFSGMTVDQVAHLHFDASALIARLQNGDVRAMILGCTGDSVPAVVSIVEDSLAEETELLQSLLAPAEDMLVSHLMSLCQPKLSLVRGITATYRMTNKPAPTSPSFYVSGILSPVETFFTSYGGTLRSELKIRLAMVLAVKLNDAYARLVEELLDGVLTAERFLKKKVATATDLTAVLQPQQNVLSDTDKIFQQVVLDVREYGRMLMRLGVDLTNMPSFANLESKVETRKPGTILPQQ